ncbi:MAG: cob(I)yrinic acid a,c-diamide adenosyltransferase [Zoogloeaceae bacterium]|nr:cob(I)yrinic acid a,c-diamide adenosyltransferase [Zoogloeaceae bacterium]
MGHRLSKIMTRTGDAGGTGLGDGSRTEKDSLRIHAIGEVDELNATVGVLLAESGLPGPVRDLLLVVQHGLFDLGGELCLPGRALMRSAQVETLETQAAALNSGLPPLKDFILPGGTRSAALAHLCRTVCRRAERAIVALGRQDPVSDISRCYINRLSDLFFILARHLNQEAGIENTLWQHASETTEP